MPNKRIDVKNLPQEVRDIIELREATDLTFSRFVDVDYTDIFWNMLAERANPEVEHSVILSVYGLQGCFVAGTKIRIKNGWKKIENVVAGDLVWTRRGLKPAIPIRKKGEFSVWRIELEDGTVLRATKDHKLFTDTIVGVVEVQKLSVGIRLLKQNGESSKIVKMNVEGIEQEVYDLHVKDVHEYVANGVLSSNSGKCVYENELVRTKEKICKMKELTVGDIVYDENGEEVTVKNVWKTEKECVKIKCDVVDDFIVSLDHRVMTKDGLKEAREITVDDKIVIGRGFERKTVFAKVGGVENVGIKPCVDIEVDGENHLFQLASGVVMHNSLSSISLACFMNPDFSVDNIFFGYDQLVYERHRLKPNSAVIVDEQSEQFGVDSHRISVVLQNLKEQLRKKSIHFFFCSPVLYPESKSSMYLLEMMFIDYETKEAYGALKTREGLTLGHVRIPHPLKILPDGKSLASKELIDAYQKKKDEHLEKVLNQRNMDKFEDWAQHVIEHELFQKAEQVYVKKIGYIPNSTLLSLINRIFPEFQAGVVVGEIAARIKLSKELSGEWEVSGRSTKRVGKDAKDRKTVKKKRKKR